MRYALTGLAVLAGLWTLVAVLAWANQDRLIFLPDRTPPNPGDVDVEEVVLTTRDGMELGAWFLAAAGADPASARPAVLVANGNAGNRQGRLGLGRALSGRGYHVLLFDYRGFGGNPGQPRVETLVDDARAAHDYLLARPDTTGIVGFGESLGSVALAALSYERDFDGLVLRSPPSSVGDVGAAAYPFLPVRTLLRHDVDVVAAMARFDGPLLVVVGTGDRVVPPELSRRVATAADAQLLEIEGAGHNDQVMFEGRLLIDAVDAFIRES